MYPDQEKDTCCKEESLSPQGMPGVMPGGLKKFEKVPIEEKIARLHLSLRDLRSNYQYLIQQNYELMKKIDELQSHQHGSDGSVMVRPNQGHQGYGGGIGSAVMAHDILA